MADCAPDLGAMRPFKTYSAGSVLSLDLPGACGMGSLDMRDDLIVRTEGCSIFDIREKGGS